MLIAVWFVWGFVSLAVAVHFYSVVHAVDPATHEVIHLHDQACGHLHGHPQAEGGDAPTTDEWRPQHDQDRAGEQQTCAFLSAAQHASSVLLAQPSLAGSPRMGLASPSGPGDDGERDIALLALAPKLPPPHLL